MGNIRKGVLSFELILVLPLLLLVLVALVHVASYLMAVQTLQAAALVGAREATLPGATEASVRGAVARALGPWRHAEVLDAERDIRIFPEGETGGPRWSSPAYRGPVSVLVELPADKVTVGSLWRMSGLAGKEDEIRAEYVLRKE